MSKQKNGDNIEHLRSRQPTVEIKEHPPELLELDDETVAIARAKFAGVDLDSVYGDDDRSSPELIVRVQSKKIRELFESIQDLKAAFSSEQKRAQALKDMLIDGIDLEFVKGYCQKKHISFSDDADALIRIAFKIEDSGDASV